MLNNKSPFTGHKSLFSVAIDSGPLKTGHAVRGIGFHTKELLRHVAKITDGKIEIEGVDLTSSDLTKYDLLHYQFFNPFFFTLPKKNIRKSIVTVHDLIYLRYPANYPPGIKGKIRFLIQKWLLKRIRGILTISETSKKDIVKFIGVSPKKVWVVHLAPREIFRQIKDRQALLEVKKRYKLPDRFVLYVGDANYNKNVIGLIRACKIVGVKLVIVGKHAMDVEGLGMELFNIHGPRDWFRFVFNKPHPELAHYRELAHEFRNCPDILRLGFVPEKDLAALFNLATVYCQPSFFEGFSLPALEASACGCPVVASDIPTHHEILGEAVVYANPKDYHDISKKVSKLFKDPELRNKYSKKGLERALLYNWDKVAKETINVYKKVLQGE